MGRVSFQGYSVYRARSIYLYGDPDRVICPVELVRDSVRGGRIRFPPGANQQP